ncbi:hypothetical protein [Pseudonocardia abyssalis]|jgi:hypothetical protein|uniref:Uncharacterized protein n=1 Tax=Pseudonocardia abyssalis TaxID=2792008 RepID=A0ABS6V3L2_9PSEU|nr:hypothetical protein [Pseudonocardia abyssalis]MBW0114463.1 hypothetical protein [Pseudonocardia abyssalis]MBW0138614.1 hypothetical protein [Pseudonocardia abyssalis]
MTTTSAASNDDGFDVVVADDGSVPAAELARHGVQPGTHLRLVVTDEPATPERRGGRSAGKLAGTVAPEVIEEWSRALDQDRAERRATLGSVAG